MKTFKGKMKLNQFSKDEMDRRKLNALKGGCDCHSYCAACGEHTSINGITLNTHFITDVDYGPGPLEY